MIAASPYNSNTIDYITIASTGDAADFGDLAVGRNGFGGCGSTTRGVFMGSSFWLRSRKAGYRPNS